MAHIPVLANEVILSLNVKNGKNFIDCTVGEGGHAELILSFSSPDGRLLGIERDRSILETAEKKLARFGTRAILVRDTYVNLSKIISSYNFSTIHGILFDLGISSYHIEESGGGFSFTRDEPLDMRFDRSEDTETAADILNQWTAEELEILFEQYGEKRYASAIAKEIVNERIKKPFDTTYSLVRIVNRIKKVPGEKIHPATKIFQALRIAVNKEAEQISDALPQAVEALERGGRLAVISFHSAEDALIKQFFAKGQAEGKIKILTTKPIAPSLIEQKENPRSRSARMRCAEKI